MVVGSYHDALRAPRRIHSFQVTPYGRRIPLPRTVTWESVRYFLGLAAILWMFANVVPVVDLLAMALAPQAAWITWHALAPAALVWVAINASLDGLRPHRWLREYVSFLLRPRYTLAGQVISDHVRYGGRVRIYWDEFAPTIRHGWVRGGTVTTRVPVRFTFAIRHLKGVMVASEHGVIATYDVDGKLEVRP